MGNVVRASVGPPALAVAVLVTVTRDLFVMPRLSVTVSWKVKSASVVGNVKLGVTVAAPVSVTEDAGTSVHEYDVISPWEPVPSSVTGEPSCTICSLPAKANGPVTVDNTRTGISIIPPKGDTMVTDIGGTFTPEIFMLPVAPSDTPVSVESEVVASAFVEVAAMDNVGEGNPAASTALRSNVGLDATAPDVAVPRNMTWSRSRALDEMPSAVLVTVTVQSAGGT